MGDTAATPDVGNDASKSREVLEVIAENVKGHVKWYNSKKRYGFIRRDGGESDLFVHGSVINSKARLPNLWNGEELEFTVVRTSYGLEARSVTAPGGLPVKRRKPKIVNQNGDTTNDEEKPVGDEFRRVKRGQPRGRRTDKYKTDLTNGNHETDGDCEAVPANGEDAYPVTRGRGRGGPRRPRGRGAYTVQSYYYGPGDQSNGGRPYRRRGFGVRYSRGQWRGGYRNGRARNSEQVVDGMQNLSLGDTHEEDRD